jgi:hypothetical protein
MTKHDRSQAYSQAFDDAVAKTIKVYSIKYARHTKDEMLEELEIELRLKRAVTTQAIKELHPEPSDRMLDELTSEYNVGSPNT